MREMKDSGVKWIGEIPKEWEICHFKNVVFLYTGNSIKDEEKDMYQDKSAAHAYIATKDIDAVFNTVDYDNGLYIKDNDLSFRIAPAQSSLMCIEGGSAGRKKAQINQAVSFVNKLCCFSGNSRVDDGYLYYFLNSPNYETEFNTHLTGLIGGVSISVLKNIHYLVPPVAVQHRIADYLNEKCTQINIIIRKQQSIIEKLKAYKLSLITETVTKGLNPDVEMKDSGIEWIGNIPSHWDILKLKAHTSMLTPMRDKPQDLDGEIPWIRIEDYLGKYIFESKEGFGVSAETVKEMNLKIYPVGTILCTSSCDLGKCAIVSKELVSNQRFIGIIPDDKTLPDYLYYLMLSNTERLNHLSTGTIQANLSRVAFEHLMVQFPPYKEQIEMSDYLDSKCSAIDNVIDSKQKMITRLFDYKKSLIYEVITGKKKV